MHSIINKREKRKLKSAVTCIPKFGSRSCRVGNGEAPSNWRPHRSREWCWMKRSCSAALPATKAAGTNPASGRRGRLTYPACRAWSREKGTAPSGDPAARSAAASLLEPFFLPKLSDFLELCVFAEMSVSSASDLLFQTGRVSLNFTRNNQILCN